MLATGLRVGGVWNSFLALLLAGVLGAQTPQDPARIRLFEAVPSAVKAGETLELRWSVTGTDHVRLEPLDQDFPAEGHVTYVLEERTIFWLHAVNDKGGHSVPLVVEALPRATPAETAVAAEEPGGRSLSPGGVWIQFAALEKVDQLQSLRKSLERITGSELAVFEIQAPGATERVLHRLRMGPFRAVREARARLRQLQPRLRRLHLKPIVTIE